jgi:hypothetical protein
MNSLFFVIVLILVLILVFVFGLGNFLAKVLEPFLKGNFSV